MTNLPPGRDLDALVAEKVMGYRREKAPPDYHGQNGGTDVLVPPGVDHSTWAYPPVGRIGPTYFVPSYSTRTEDAWPVVEKLPARCLITYDGRWHIRETLCVTHHGDSGEVTYSTRPFASGDTLAHAICLAALRVVEEQDGGTCDSTGRT